MNAWRRYGLPIIPAMLVGMAATFLIGFPEPQLSAGLYQPGPSMLWVLVVLGVVLATYVVGVAVARWWRR
jgi:hypothetical protein